MEPMMINGQDKVVLDRISQTSDYVKQYLLTNRFFHIIIAMRNERHFIRPAYMPSA